MSSLPDTAEYWNDIRGRSVEEKKKADSKCRECGASFGLKSELRRHMKSAHGYIANGARKPPTASMIAMMLENIAHGWTQASHKYCKLADASGEIKRVSRAEMDAWDAAKRIGNQRAKPKR